MNGVRAIIIIWLAFGGGVGLDSVFASNLTITPTFESSITSLSNASAVESAINATIAAIGNDITSNAAIDVTIDFNNTTSGLGSSITAQEDIPYSTYLSLLGSNPNKTTNVVTALASLPSGSYSGINNNASRVILTSANLLAIGDANPQAGLSVSFLELLNGGFDSRISLNTALISSNNYNLQAVVAHEIDEALGIGGNGSSLDTKGATDIGPLDLYRYSASGVRSYTESTSAVSYFSINGGVTKLVNFNQQVTFNATNNASADYGDWGSVSNTMSGNAPAQVQDAYDTPGAVINLGPNELTALNVIGWNLTPAGMLADGLVSGTLPVPGTVWLVLIGLLGCMRMSRLKLICNSMS